MTRVTANGNHSKSATVTVGLKLPNGLLLRIFEFVEVDEQYPLGSRKVKMAREIGDGANRVEIRGYNSALPPGGLVTPGFALTPNVPKDFWEPDGSINRGALTV